MAKDDLIPDDIKDLPGYRRPIRRVDVPHSSIPNPPKIPGVENLHLQNDDEKCEIKDIEEGVIVPYRLPPGAAVTGPDAVVAELRAIEKILHSHELLFQDIRSYLSYKIPPESANLLETQQATRVATPGVRNTITQDQVTDGVIPGYDEIEVWNLLGGRKAPRVWLVNDGVQGTGAGDNLFLRVSPDGKNFSPEFIMILGEIRIANDIYAIRFRSPTANITLRASEREIYPPYVTTIANTFSTSGAENMPNFVAQNLGVPPAAAAPDPNVGVPAGQQLPNIIIPDGFSLVVRSNIGNAFNIFVSNADATIVANSITLAPGDGVALMITNANLIRVAAAGLGQTIDLIVEQA